MHIRPLVQRLLLSALPVALLASWQAAPPAHEVRVGPRLIDAPSHLVGRLIPDLAFVDLQGNAGKLSDLRSSKLLVICLTSTDCPIARKYSPRLVEIEKRYRDRGVTFLMVNAQEHETAEDMRKAVDTFGFVARYVPDRKGRIAAALRATSTTEVFVLDAARTLLYRGAVDDQYGLGFTLPEARRTLLADALDAALAIESPEVRATTAPGCELAVPEDAGATPEPPTEVTWHNRISRIVQNNCEVCHRPGQAGPFELLTYEDVDDHAKTIRREVERLTMPPWFAEGPRGHWANDARLTDEDRQDFLAWLAGARPVGDERDAPIPRRWPDKWLLEHPDLVLDSPVEIAVAAEGAMPYQDIYFEPKLPEDKWVGGIEIRNLHPQVMHHAIAFLEYPDDHPHADEQQVNPSRSGGFAWMAPGWSYTRHPKGMAKRLYAGVNIRLQVHYTPNGVALIDRPSLAFQFVDEPIHAIKTRAADNRSFEIPAGAERYPVKASYTFENPASIISLAGHTHLRGVGFDAELAYPDGRVEKILEHTRYDFNWQLQYTLAEPIEVPAGSVITATGYYDNSSKNPANPDPTKPVRYGVQSWDEMMLLYFTMYPLPTNHPVPDRAERAGFTARMRLERWLRNNKVSLLAVGAVSFAGLGWLAFRRRARPRPIGVVEPGRTDRA